MKAEEFDKKFEEGREDLTCLLDLSKVRRVGMKEKLLALPTTGRWRLKRKNLYRMVILNDR